MHKARNCRYTQRLVYILIFTNICLSAEINNQKKCRLYNDSFYNEIKFENIKSNMFIEYQKMFIPCSLIASHEVDVNDIDQESLNYIIFWLRAFLTPMIYNIDSVKYLTNVYSSADDIVIGFGKRNNVQYEFIDGRMLFVILQFDNFEFDMVELINNPFLVFEKISPYIQYSSFNILNDPQIKLIEKSQNEICFEVTDTVFINKYKIIDRATNKMIISKNKILFVIDKIGAPFFSKLGYIEEKTVGGISYKNKNSFKRFFKSSKTDMHREFNSIFVNLPKREFKSEIRSIPIYPTK